MTMTDGMGYVAASLVLATFCAKRMVSLRALAISSNVAFITYGLAAQLWPIVMLHVIMLPLTARPGTPAEAAGDECRAYSVPLVGGTDTRSDQHDAADDIAKCRVVIDAADAPSVIGTLPAHLPFPDPSRQGLAPIEGTGDDGLAGARWRQPG